MGQATSKRASARNLSQRQDLPKLLSPFITTSHVLTLNFVIRRKLSCLLKKNCKYRNITSDRERWQLRGQGSFKNIAVVPFMDTLDPQLYFGSGQQWSNRPHALWWIYELESSWLWYREVIMLTPCGGPVSWKAPGLCTRKWRYLGKIFLKVVSKPQSGK